MRIQQALFIAPCSHAFHYKCIRPLLETHHPAFSCPLCRTFANLEEDVEVDGDMDQESIAEMSAVIAATTPATPVAPPMHEHSRERDAGAETEVEPDMGSGTGLRLGASLRRRQANVPPIPNGGLEPPLDFYDVEMEDAPLPALPEDMDDIDPEPLGASRLRDMSISPVPMAARTIANRSTDRFFEHDGEASGSGEADAGASDSSGNNIEAVINGKRKR